MNFKKIKNAIIYFSPRSQDDVANTDGLAADGRKAPRGRP
ncbi:hypothetical protein GTCCBUS3UF5_18970 [Geobacillus thermoleovorans CCB_US3_UF5]|uniref:Uncharacterized protein n=1 Tax=Geobacillus thermoleovorans CCB_US3_UF5 TaxID=1111068 RepID=A0ABN3ZTY0_GEOTH|nr:hypothetical protein GTCCBUS3UF5_18970 [Geobacillus thermoleovorans CCB_US3_UF5]GAJ58997.1 hypothetical protein B23_2221 [Geobacillus thermoleovorans B23]